MKHGKYKYSNGLYLVFRRLGASEADAVPDALVDEIRHQLQNHIQAPGSQRERPLTRQNIENYGGYRRAEQSVTDRFRDAAGVSIHRVPPVRLDCTISL